MSSMDVDEMDKLDESLENFTIEMCAMYLFYYGDYCNAYESLKSGGLTINE